MKKNFKISIVPLVMFLLCIVNLLYMHYYIFSTCNIEAEVDITSFLDNVCAIVFDALILLSFFAIIIRKLRYNLLCCFITTAAWAFCNILYSRFFFRYISFSSIGQTSNLFDWFMVECMIDGLQFSDFYFVFVPILFYLLYKRCSATQHFTIRTLRTVVTTLLVLVLLNLSAHLLFCASNSQFRYISYYKYRLYFTHVDTSRNMGRPNWTNFHRGSFRTLAADMVANIHGDIDLTEEQKSAITQCISDNTQRRTAHQVNPDIRNVIFILVESYTAFTTDMTIDGKEVTPFLNKLSREPNVYYNGNMKSNITIGQSSDGQFLYMTGLLPLRSIITVSRAKHNVLQALPKMMKKFNPSMETRMVIPTLPSLWEQDAMCQAYGFDRLYSSNDFKGEHERNLNDEQVFQLSQQLDRESTKPFFSYILTMSMHGPYNTQMDPTFPIQDQKFCPELNNFLNVCHYTDHCIEKYVANLKETGLYDNSLIIIAPDHQVPENTVDTEQYGITRELPLFIINGNIDLNSAWGGACNQLDVFTTLLDILGIDSAWRGLGGTLLSPNYHNSLTNQKWDISEWILLSNYFKNTSR